MSGCGVLSLTWSVFVKAVSEIQLFCFCMCARPLCHVSTHRLDIVSERISYNVPEVPLCNHHSFDCRFQCA